MEANATEFVNNSEISASKDLLPVLHSPQIARALIRNEDLRRNLVENKSVEINIATQENPAHAFVFAGWNLPEEKRISLQQRIIDHFNQNPESGILLNLRGDVVRGFLTSSSQKDLENSLRNLNSLMTEMKSEADPDPKQGFALLISESPELQVEINTLGKTDNDNPHFVMIPVSDSGLTHISWATSYLKSQKDPEDVGGIFWVTTSRQQEARGNLRRDPIVEGLESERCTPSKVKGVTFHLTGIGPKYSSPEGELEVPKDSEKEFWDPLMADFDNLPDEDQQLLLTTSVGGYPAKALYEKDGPWISRKVTPEGIEALIEGQHVRLKIDFSGMSKLMGKGISIGPYLKDVFSDLATIVGEDNQIPYYQALLEGDAMVMYLVMPGPNLQETIKHFLEVQAKLEEAFNKRLSSDMDKGLLSGDIGEHEIGVKAFARISNDPVTLRFLKGGLSRVKDPKFNNLEDLVEALAKKGAAVTGIVHDKKIDPQDVEALYKGIPHRTILLQASEKSDESTEVYLIKKQTVYEQRYAVFIDALETELPKLERQVAELDERLHQLVYHADLETENVLAGFGNNDLTSGKVASVIEMLKQKGGVDMSTISRVLRLAFSPKTCEYINILCDQIEGNLPSQSRPPEIASVAPVYDWMQSQLA